MTQREAKHMACALAAHLLHTDSHQDGWLAERLGDLSAEDRERVLQAMLDLVDELSRRGWGR